MIETLKSNHALPLDDIYTLAEGSRRLRSGMGGQVGF